MKKIFAYIALYGKFFALLPSIIRYSKEELEGDEE
jgi:hypothetical protein